MQLPAELARVLALLMFVSTGCSQSDGEQPLSTSSSTAAQSLISANDEAWDRYLEAVAEAEQIEGVEARCLAYPDVPANAWPQDAARAACSRLQAASPSLAEVDALLADTDGVARLEQMFSERLDAHYRAPHRDILFIAYGDFGGDANSRRVAGAWLAKASDSPFARMAMGRHLVSAAGDARGDKRITETPDASRERMARLMRQGVDMLTSALKDEPRLSPACTDLIYAARLMGDGPLQASAIAHCLAIDPLSSRVRFQWLMTMDPRWGGSLEMLDIAIDDLRPLVDSNPALGAFLGRGVGLRAYLDYLGGASRTMLAPRFEAASQLGPDPLYIGHAGAAAREQQEFRKALGYLSQALRFAPGDTWLLDERALVRKSLGDYPGAIEDARRAIGLGAPPGRIFGTLGQSLAALGRDEEARGAYRQAMQSPGQRQWAFRRWCDSLIRRSPSKSDADACTRGLVSEYPDDPEGLFMRSWVLYEAADPAATDMAARFYRVADMRNDRQRQMASELARIAN